MIEINPFSGNIYIETGNMKQSNEGPVFMKCGNSWVGGDGQIIQIREDDLLNITTGISSNFGDPFKELK